MKDKSKNSDNQNNSEIDLWATADAKPPWGFIFTVSVIVLVYFLIYGYAKQFPNAPASPQSVNASTSLQSVNAPTTIESINAPTSFVKGRVIKISSKLGYVDIRVSCKNRNCNIERFDFKKDMENTLYIALINNAEIMVSYDDRFFSNSIRNIEFQ